MKIETKTFGIQANRFYMLDSLLHKVRYWASKKAKSFSIGVLVNTDYYGTETQALTGYGRAEVTYFTTEKEGQPLNQKYRQSNKETNWIR